MALTVRSRRKKRREKHKPELVTGDFELHFEDVLNRNRFASIAVIAAGLVLLVAFIPVTVYRSAADTDQIYVEAENGFITNPELVGRVEGDINASGDGFLEFSLSR